jgi:TonB-linked SusC/RagA family outer membrane protein
VSLLGQIKISGTVSDATDGSPLPGANIVIKGTSTGTVTDQNGAYTFEVPSDAVLVVSYVGYLAEEIEVAGKSTVNIILTPDLAKLEEVVVVGYGTMRKTDVTGAVSSLREDDIKSLKSSNAVEALQGKIAGVDLTRSDGRAGSGYNILIRGARSFSASNDPLYIVDGVDYGSNININPSDIASIDVLKDASSTAIYGSRGANGVVFITTKKGNQGKTIVNFNTYYGFTTPLGKLPMGDANYYLRMIRDTYRTNNPAYWDSADSQVPVLSLLSPEEIEGYNNGTDFDWIDAQMKDHGSQQDYYLSVSGGSEKSNYLISLNHFVEDNYIPNDNYKRYSIKSDVNTKVGKFFEIGNSTFISYSLLNRGQGINYNFIPLVTPYDENGDLKPVPNSRVPFSNMLIDQDPKYKSNENSRTGLFSTFYGQLNLLPGLTFKSLFNLNIDFQRIGTYTGEYEGLARSNESDLTIINNYKWTWTNILTYDKTISNHHILATAATETRYSLTERYYQAGQDLDLGEFKWFAIRTSDPAQLTINDQQSPYIKATMVSFIGRLNYSFKEKYLASFTGRYDGASQLVEKWDFFPSVSVGWRISEENFMKELAFLSNLKLRVGYGLTGNYSVDPYASLGSTTDYPLYYQFGVTESTVNGYRTGQLSTSPKWETSNATNFGVDFGFLRNRISGSLEIYKVHTYNILQQVVLPPTSAVTTVLENIGETKGNGIELTINSVNIQTKDFKWSTSITFSRSTEEITYLAGGVSRDVVNGWFVGHPLQVFYDWDKVGIWQTDEAAQATLYGSVPGDIKLKDVNADTTIDEDDRVILGTPRPKWTGGLNSTMNYKNFDFSVFVYARVGQMIMDIVEGMWSPDCRENSVERDYWTPNNPTNEYPRINPGLTRSGWSKATTLQYQDGTFVKIKDITLGYKIPVNLTSKIAVSSFRIYISAKNYFVLGKNFSKGRYDPEAVNSIGRSNVGFPAPKMIAIGANVTF